MTRVDVDKYVYVSNGNDDDFTMPRKSRSVSTILACLIVIVEMRFELVPYTIYGPAPEPFCDESFSNLDKK